MIITRLNIHYHSTTAVNLQHHHIIRQRGLRMCALFCGLKLVKKPAFTLTNGGHVYYSPKRNGEKAAVGGLE